jgi:hypothetical protein
MSSGIGQQQERSEFPISEVVTADGAGTSALETGMAPLVQGMQKTGPRLEKQFLDHRLAAPEKGKEKKPEGLKARPTWWQRDRLGVCWVVGRGVADC